ncbi:tyrosine-type recombinase/integrase [Sphingomonas sp.]|uniref:tyrosine-type recombinase/integrase n=1 Tax=Sphingomonas sp. TaxID=28214 RepID=UPI001B1C7D33|nr:tyrosine-type recombinase/integrase [Sphingomonas sp.]MBO9714994.1 tyrosine-type recombinase/integrase [Sphingomonas sp.]
MAEVFKLSRRKGSAKWQVRKRWPSDVAAILKGEFNASTGEEDRKQAQERLPLIAAEYERRVREARDGVSAAPRSELSEAEAHRMAAEFYRNTLPAFVVRRQVEMLEHRELLSTTRERLATARASLGRNDYTPVYPLARTMARQAGIELADEGPSADYLRRMLMRAFVELHEAAVAHLEGVEYSPRDTAMRDLPEAAREEPGKTLEALLEAYEKEKAPGWSGSSKKAAVPVFRLLRDVFPGRAVASISREEARGVVTLLESLPTNLGKRKELKGLTVLQAVEKGKMLNLPIIQPKTINDGYLIHIAAIFNWAVREQWIPSSPFGSLSVFDPVDDAERRDPFSGEQLQTLFSASPWDRPWSADLGRLGDYWVPLLCLFHGLRNGEAVGLRVEDVGSDADTPVLHIRAYGEKRLKTKEARATLPLHPELARLGFLTFVETRRSAGEMLLFPEGVVNGRGQVGAKLAREFRDRVKAMGLEGRKLGMHSFRHCYEDALARAELPDRTRRALARRAEVGSGRVYGSGISIRQLAASAAKIDYPRLDLSHLYAR